MPRHIIIPLALRRPRTVIIQPPAVFAERDFGQAVFGMIDEAM
ncbi:UNVERIFIED_ORG: hypothetical protein GGI57_001596 [Rhizobium aethiopicum]